MATEKIVTQITKLDEMLVYLMSLSYPDMLVELSRREKEANIKPDADIDVYMKVKSFT